MLRKCSLALAASLVVLVAWPPATVSAVPVPVDRLLVVDCLLPGQVRKLGGAMTYLSPGRPAKMVASECEIRGGAYVAYDRANFGTALQVWKPQAENGDPQAQTYVGEIYEKGLGTAPDYSQAAAWYQKAADQGYPRGLSNLAYLYEQGLGVPKDPVKALNLYRQSAGISTDELTFASEVTAAKEEAASQISVLTQQLSASNEEAESLRAELEQAKAEAQQRRNALALARHETDALRTQVQQLQNGSSAGSQEEMAELRRLQSKLAAREAQISQQQKEAQTLEAATDARATELAQRLQRADTEGSQLRAQLGGDLNDSQQARAELAASQARMESMNAQIAQLQGELSSERSALEKERAQIASRTSAQDSSRSDELSRLRQTLADREARLAQQQSVIASVQTQREAVGKEVERLKAQLVAAEQQQQKQVSDNESLRAQLASTQQRLLLSQQKLNDANATLAAERTRIALEREQLQQRRDTASSQQQAEIRRLTEELGQREAKLIEQRSTIAGYEAESNSYSEDASRLKSEQQRIAMRSVDSAAVPTASTNSGPLATPRDLNLGGYYALVIGNNSYQNLPSLNSPVNDAQGLERVLKEHYGFKTRLLINATRADILGALNEYVHSLGERDSLLIYYAGHGELDERTLRGYWLPVNAKRDDTTEWISDRMITDQIQVGVMAARHVLVIADSCYSGAMTRSSGVRLVARGGGQSAELKVLVFKAKFVSRTVLTSGSEAPVLDGGAGSNSIFARALINALSRNQVIMDEDTLYNQIFDPVRKAAARFNVEQSPRHSVLADAGGTAGEFLLIPTT